MAEAWGVVVVTRLLAALALLLLPACATICHDATGLKKIACDAIVTPPPAPPPEVAYVVREGDAVCRDLAVPAWLEIGGMTGKLPGDPMVEAVIAWGVTAGDLGAWHGGNPTDPAIFSFRAHDSRSTWGKLKTHGAGQGYVGEPPLRMAWAPAESYALRFEVGAGETSWTATRASDGATATARQAAQGPERVTICIGDPGTRKAAIGSSYTGIRWSGP